MKLLYILLFTLFTGTVFSQHFSEDFSSFPNGWTVQSGGTSTASGIALWHGDSTANDTSAVITKIDDYVVHDEWLISPTFFVPTSPKTLLQFDFKASNFWMITPFDSADLVVHITADSGATWIPVWNEDSVHFDSYQWTTDYIDISAFQNDSIQIGYQYKGRKGNAVNIDNVVVRDAPEVDLIIEDIYWYYPESKSKINYSGVSQSWDDSLVVEAYLRNIGWNDSAYFLISLNASGGTSHNDFLDSIKFSGDTVVKFDLLMGLNGGGTVSVILSGSSIIPEDDISNNNLFKLIQLIGWGGRYSKSETLPFGFFDAVDFDEDGVDDPYEIVSSFEIPKNASGAFSGYSYYANINSASPEVYYNQYWPDSANNYYPLMDGLTMPVPTSIVLPFQNSTIAVPFLLHHYMMHFPNNIWNADSLITFHAVHGFNIDHVGFGYSQTMRHPSAQLIVYQTTLGADTFQLRECPTLGIDELWGGLFEDSPATIISSIWPNPCSKIANLHFEMENQSNAIIIISGINGSIYQSTNLGIIGAGEHNFDLDVSELANGLYLYTVQLDNQSVTGKLKVSR
ncbi:MAG: hypothetical protein ACI9J3_003998 [Parvicellaceae bacterium]|jgi:hypothetical protein